MEMTKRVTEKVIAANRRNAQKSTGPKTPAGKAAVGRNPVKHGLLARRIIIRNGKEKTEFESFVVELEDHFQPEGPVERMLVEEIAVCWWKLQKALGWEQETWNRHTASKTLLNSFVEVSEDAKLPLFSNSLSDPPALPLGWDCREFVLRASGKTEKDDGTRALTHEKVNNQPSLSTEWRRSSTHGSETDGRTEMELRVGNPMETILRYQTTIKRDLYRAIGALQDMQDQRVSQNTSRVPKKPVVGLADVRESSLPKKAT